LAARFLLNLPASEFESFERLFFTVEEALQSKLSPSLIFCDGTCLYIEFRI
jgi:hypothetical protein